MPESRYVGGEDQGLGAHSLHYPHPHDGLPRAARKHDDAAAAGGLAARVKRFHGLHLVGPQGERPSILHLLPQLDFKRRPLSVPGNIFDGIANSDERYLELPPKSGLDSRAVDALALLKPFCQKVFLEVLHAEDLFEELAAPCLKLEMVFPAHKL